MNAFPALEAVGQFIASGGLALNVLITAALLSATSLAYSRLKRLPLLRTLAVAFTWTWACTVLPLAGAEHPLWSWLALDTTVPLILMLCAACLLCDLKDARGDREQRVPSLPVLIGVRPTCLLASALAPLANSSFATSLLVERIA